VSGLFVQGFAVQGFAVPDLAVFGDASVFRDICHEGRAMAMVRSPENRSVMKRMPETAGRFCGNRDNAS